MPSIAGRINDNVRLASALETRLAARTSKESIRRGANGVFAKLKNPWAVALARLYHGMARNMTR
ncbi:hypothetical protein CCM_08484 [Cordyceps militaris CM01]|uniref:Uncharacterized protein n=1 Tax=Cordyceps militaris (strain CM01) TaxID=983644 RepID=G3JRQ0_CORMM|nr:uncharacterized protein CCM_08484 [Cordyceps militaris CM01]EGX88440.1 hypothetical protein CCM_08484 [Cordyceps militaris CM01]